VRQQLEEAGLSKVNVVQRKVNVECRMLDVFMATLELVLGMLSMKWPEEKREEWIKEVRKGMRDILVKDVGGPNELVFMEFEGIVGVGVKE
jgi:hypothetical protein